MKKKAFQKLTALVAVTAMSASLLTGCGSDASGSNDAATNNAQESAASVGTQEANSEHPSWISEDPLEIGIMVMDSSQQPMAQDSKSHEAISRLFLPAAMMRRKTLRCLHRISRISFI